MAAHKSKSGAGSAARQITDCVLLLWVAGFSGGLPQMLENRGALSDRQAHLLGWAILIGGAWIVGRLRGWKSWLR